MSTEFIDLEKLYQDAVDECSRKAEYGGYRLNFGVYYTPKILWVA